MRWSLLSAYLAPFLAASVQAGDGFFLVGHSNILTTQRIDPIVDPGKVAGHVHTVIGGSNFGLSTNTATLRNSQCTTNPIKQDKSNYWFPSLYFQWKNGSFSSVDGGVVTYYLFDDDKTVAFPDNFRMISGNPTRRAFKNDSAAAAVTFLCLDFNSKNPAPRSNALPTTPCPSGIRAQINFPSCWNGKDADSSDHQSHVAYRSGGPDTGSCTDPKFPVSIPRIFMEFYTDTGSWDAHRSQAMNPNQPFVYSTGDPLGYSYHADFVNGWDSNVLQNVVNKCSCTAAAFGDITCCANQGVIDLQKDTTCRITDSVKEQTLGTIPVLPGNNPIRSTDPAPLLAASGTPAIVGPVKAYTNGVVPSGAGTNILSPASSSGSSSFPSSPPPPSDSSSTSLGKSSGGSSAPPTVYDPSTGGYGGAVDVGGSSSSSAPSAASTSKSRGPSGACRSDGSRKKRSIASVQARRIAMRHRASRRSTVF